MNRDARDPGSPPPSPPHRSSVLGRLALKFVPRSLRERHGRDLLEAWEDRFGRHSGPAYWSRVFLDASVTGTSARLEALGRAGRVPYGTWFLDFGSDFSRGLRLAWRSKAYSAVVIGTVAIGIAVNTAIFSLMNPFFFRALPYEDPDELVQLGLFDDQIGFDMIRVSTPQFDDWRERATVFDDMALYSYRARTLGTEADGAAPIMIGELSGNLFELLGASAVVGRLFGPDEDRPDAPDVVVISEATWRDRFQRSPDAIGATLVVDGVPHTVLGVVPEGFNFPFPEVSLWEPLGVDRGTQDRDRNVYLPVARLAPGQGPAQARAQMATIHRALAALHPDHDGQLDGVTVQPLREALNFAYDEIRLSASALLAAVFFVLLIACANVAGIALARSSARQQEMAVRAAVGAGRGRLVRQLLSESLVFAVAGAGLALLLVHVALSVVAPLVPQVLFRTGDFSVDGRVLAFTGIVTLAATIGFGLTPALAGSRTGLGALLRGSRGTGRATLGGRRMLVVAEVALAVVLLAGAGLMARSVLRLLGSDLGLRTDHTLVATLTPSVGSYAGADELAELYDRVLAELSGVPGVNAAAHVSPLPLNNATFSTEYSVAGQPVPDGQGRLLADWFSVSPGYRETVEIPRITGRDFDRSDGRDATPVVAINEVMRRRHWPERSPVGESIVLGTGDDAVTATVVAVYGDVQHRGLDPVTQAQIYRPAAQFPTRARTLVMHVSGNDPARVTPEVRAAFERVDAGLPPRELQPMSVLVLQSSFQWSFTSGLLALFGAIALLLASMGIYGLISYTVSLRRREIGIRLALGAPRSSVRRDVLGDAVRMALMGAALGGLVALGAGRVLEAFFYGVDGTDPLVLGAVAATFVAVALASAALPARRALRTDPATTLREE